MYLYVCGGVMSCIVRVSTAFTMEYNAVCCVAYHCSHVFTFHVVALANTTIPIYHQSQRQQQQCNPAHHHYHLLNSTNAIINAYFYALQRYQETHVSLPLVSPSLLVNSTCIIGSPCMNGTEGDHDHERWWQCCSKCTAVAVAMCNIAKVHA